MRVSPESSRAFVFLAAQMALTLHSLTLPETEKNTVTLTLANTSMDLTAPSTGKPLQDPPTRPLAPKWPHLIQAKVSRLCTS